MTQPFNTLDTLDTLDSIRERRTLKVISEKPLPATPLNDELIETLIESAYYAPFHYPCSNTYQKNLTSPLPWRFYVLPSQACRNLAAKLKDIDKPAGKIIGMLNTADYVIQSTWCPMVEAQSKNDSGYNSNWQNNDLFIGNLVNMEHIAASGAAIQNLLITATALGHENYWSSGGILRDEEVYKLLSMPCEEILLGSLFIFPNEQDNDTAEISVSIEYLPSKKRDRRGEISDSYTIINL